MSKRLRLDQQLLGSHVCLDRINDDTDRFSELVEESELDLVEFGERSKFDHGLDLTFEKHRKHDNIGRRRFTQPRVYFDVAGRRILYNYPLLFDSAFSNEAFAQLKFRRYRFTLAGRVTGQKLENRIVLGGVGDIENSVLHLDEGGHFGENKPGNCEKVSLALQKPREFCKVGLKPILLGILLRRFSEIPYHLVDVILQERHLPRSVNSDRTRQIAFRYGCRKVGHGSRLVSKVGGELVHIIR